MDRFEIGEVVVIGRDGKPVARLVAITLAAPRQPGVLKGLGMPDDFLAPPSDVESADWE